MCQSAITRAFWIAVLTTALILLAAVTTAGDGSFDVRRLDAWRHSDRVAARRDLGQWLARTRNVAAAESWLRTDLSAEARVAVQTAVDRYLLRDVPMSDAARAVVESAIRRGCWPGEALHAAGVRLPPTIQPRPELLIADPVGRVWR